MSCQSQWQLPYDGDGGEQDGGDRAMRSRVACVVAEIEAEFFQIVTGAGEGIEPALPVGTAGGLGLLVGSARTVGPAAALHGFEVIRATHGTAVPAACGPLDAMLVGDHRELLGCRIVPDQVLDQVVGLLLPAGVADEDALVVLFT